MGQSNRWRIWLWCGLLSGVLLCAGMVGCQTNNGSSTPVVETFVPDAPTVEVGAPSTPLIRTEAPPELEFSTPVPPDPIQTAIAALADHLNVVPQTISFVDASPVEWEDSSLGCPEGDQVYLPVITSGYLVRLTYDGQQYEVHTDLAGTAVVCTASAEVEVDQTIRDPIVAEFIASARSALASQLGVRPQDVALVRSEAVTWSSSALGCTPSSGEEVIQAETTGYRIVLAVDETRYEFHTDQQRMIRCEVPTE